MRGRWSFVVGSLLLAGFAACSSSSPVGVPGLDASANAQAEAAAGPSEDAAAEPGYDATGAVEDAPVPTVDALADGDPGDSALDASTACVTFCTCMAMNCADRVFGGGCLYECATQTTWDLPCRTNMCSLVPAQPNSDHCTHAMGINECLNE